MLFITRPEFELTFGPEWPWLDGPPGNQQWCAVELDSRCHWFIVELLGEQLVDGNLCATWKTTCCTDVRVVICLTQNARVLDKKISVVIPADESPKQQVGIKAVQRIYGWNEDIYEVVTMDDDRFYFPIDNSPAAGSERKTYYEKRVDRSAKPRSTVAKNDI